MTLLARIFSLGCLSTKDILSAPMWTSWYKNCLKTISQDQSQNMKYHKKKHKPRQRIIIAYERRGIEVQKPKSHGNAFTLYLKTLDRGEARLMEFIHTAACNWCKLTTKEKDFFHRKAKTLEDQYQNKLSLWQTKMLKAGREDLVKEHQQLVELKSFATKNRNIEEQDLEVTPQAAKAEPMLTLSDDSHRSNEIIEEQHEKVKPESVEIEPQLPVSENPSKRYIHRIIFK